MSYIVIQPGPSGSAEYRQFDELAGAVTHLERVCNGSGSADARLFRLDPVQYQVRKYFKVEIQSAPQAPAPSAPTAPVSSAPQSPAPQVIIPEIVDASVFDPLPMDEGVHRDSDSIGLDDQTSTDPRRGLFGR